MTAVDLGSLPKLLLKANPELSIRDSGNLGMEQTVKKWPRFTNPTAMQIQTYHCSSEASYSVKMKIYSTCTISLSATLPRDESRTVSPSSSTIAVNQGA